MSKKLSKLSKHVIVKPVTEDKYSTLSVYKTNDKKNEYYISTVCERDANKRRDELRERYPQLREVKTYHQVPNAKHLLDRVKQEMQDHTVESNRNNMVLKSGVTQKKLLGTINNVQKKNVEDAVSELTDCFSTSFSIK